MNSSPWIRRLLNRPENAFMCAVDVSYFRDKFNLVGLEKTLPDYETAVRVVLDDAPYSRAVVDPNVQSSAELFYGLVHARYVMTPRGIAKILEKYLAGCFGHCPRDNCKRSVVLPIGRARTTGLCVRRARPVETLTAMVTTTTTYIRYRNVRGRPMFGTLTGCRLSNIGLCDAVGADTVRIYCPRCMDVYVPPAAATGAAIDGAYFGTGLPHMVFMTRPEYAPQPPSGRHVAKLYGFRVHDSAYGSHRVAATELRRTVAKCAKTCTADTVAGVPSNTAGQTPSVVNAITAYNDVPPLKR